MKRLMIIDDNDEFVDMIKQYFVDDYLVYTYTNFTKISDIIDRVLKILPNIILLDVNLGIGDGIEVVKIFSSNECLKKIPVLMLTADDYNTVVENIVKKEPNVVGFYSKLSSLEAVKEKVEMILTKE